VEEKYERQSIAAYPCFLCKHAGTMNSRHAYRLSAVDPVACTAAWFCHANSTHRRQKVLKTQDQPAQDCMRNNASIKNAGKNNW